MRRPIYHSSLEEIDLSFVLREKAVAEIGRIGLKEAASKLGLMPGGVEALLWKSKWELQIAFRAVRLLDVCRLEVVS